MTKIPSLLTIALFAAITGFAQEKETKEKLPNDWHLQDKESSGIYGISLDKAYSFVKAKKIKSKTIIVAVIDSGIDTLHEDLKPILWTNPKEIPGKFSNQWFHRFFLPDRQTLTPGKYPGLLKIFYGKGKVVQAKVTFVVAAESTKKR